VRSSFTNHLHETAVQQVTAAISFDTIPTIGLQIAAANDSLAAYIASTMTILGVLSSGASRTCKRR